MVVRGEEDCVFENLQVIKGETTAASGRVYARLPRAEFDAAIDFKKLRLAGTIVGPYNHYSATLPATIPFQSATSSSDDDLLIEVVVPDPCTWTLDSPATYQIQLQLHDGDAMIEDHEALFGFRRIGVVGHFFSHEGKRWVLRAAALPSGSDPTTFLTEFRESRLVCVVGNPTDDICRQASKIGTMLLADLSGAQNANDVGQQLAILARWPAVMGCLIDERLAAVDRIGTRNLVIGCHGVRDDVDFLLCDADQLVEGCEKPIVVYQSPGTPSSDLPMLRTACEELQRALTPRDFAGYVGQM